MGWLDDQVALVTGGGSGIGLAVVERFLAEGARGVGVLERSPERVAELGERFGDRVVALPGDVTRIEDNDRAVAATVERFGRLDTFIGNAGIWDYMLSLSGESAERLAAAHDEIMAINVKGYLLGAKAALEELRKTKGTMVFTASISSFMTGGGGPIYIASKHAVAGLVKALAYELAPDIRVNGIGPGGTITKLSGASASGHDQASMDQMPGLDEMIGAMTPLGFAAKPEDHTSLYVLLASREHSRYITGVVIPSDGGALVGKRPDA